jgi:hypothetical protein
VCVLALTVVRARRHHRFSLTTVTIASALLLMGFFSKRGRPFSPSNAFLTF